MGRDHRLPRALGKVSGRGTPLAASIFVLTLYLVTVFVTEYWTGLFAQPGMPHYAAMFSWFSTLGSFSLACIYLLMSAGALRGLADHPRRWAVNLAAAVGIVVTAAAIYGAVYQVKAPVIWAVWAGVGILVLGFVLAVLHPGRAPRTSPFDELAAADRGPQKA